MAEITIPLSDEVEQELEESGINVQEVVKEAINSKLFEKQLSRSKALQRVMFETLIAKSTLTEKDARELAEKVDKGMLEQLKDRFSEM